MSRWDLSPEMSLEALVALWLEDVACQLDPLTLGLYRLHARKHLVPHFGDAQLITARTIAEYSRARLRVVKRATLQKERSTLNGFLAWCQEQRYLLEPPEMPKLPKRAAGTPFETRRRGAATPLSPEECRAILAALPEWSSERAGKRSFPVRARFILMHETALRPATLDALSVPEHYSRGASTLIITDGIDKAKFGRELPLSAAARVALDSVCRPGVLFGSHDYRHHLGNASKEALPAAKARTFTAYDLRHARLTELAETGNLPGVAYLAGHRRVTTTSLYVRPGLRAAERTLEAFEPKTDIRPTLLVGQENLLENQRSAKERTRTSTGVTPLAPQASASDDMSPIGLLRQEAVALLRCAATDTPVEYARLRALARGALELTDLGRLALGVLDGGRFGSTRALELAQLIATSGRLASTRKGGE